MNSEPGTRCSIEVEPRLDLTDTEVKIRLSGFPPHQRVTVRAQTWDDDFGRAWDSMAVLEVDAGGTLEVGRQAPVAGTYDGTDAMGLFWSMVLDPAVEEECYFRKRTLDPVRVTLTAEVEGEAMASTTAERLFLAPGTRRIEVREEGVVGTFFHPPEPGPHPGIIVLGGGDGGLLEHGAAMLASRGYSALALAYFGLDPLPPEAHEIPLEYFGRAIRWLQARPEVDEQAIALVGTSLGGLYALLAAATYPAVKAVVGYVPLGIVMGMGPENRSPCSYKGEPLPCLPIVLTLEEEQRLEEMVRAREPVSLKPVLLRLLEDESLVAPAEIQVERIQGPVLLVTGEDDQAVPSPVLADRIMARLRAHDSPYPHRHLCYTGAGHAIGLPHAHGLPYVPTYGREPATGPLWAFGGATRANALANAASWLRVLVFLGESLKPEE